MRYRGLTHPVPAWALITWRWLMCWRGMHAFDEVCSDKHYLSCDACGITVDIGDDDGDE